VHREELVVELGGDEMLIWSAKLRADDECLDSAEHEEKESRVEVQDSDSLVVYGREPGPES
jgi:hypothetical protein